MMLSLRHVEAEVAEYRAHESDMEIHEVCKRFLQEMATEMAAQAEVIEEHVALGRAHRKLLAEKRSLRQSLLEVQQQRGVVQEELRAEHGDQAVVTEARDEASGLSVFLSNLENTLHKAAVARGPGASQFPPPPENLGSLAMLVQRNARNLRFVAGVNMQLRACLQSVNEL